MNNNYKSIDMHIMLGRLYLSTEPKKHSLRDLGKMLGVSHVVIRENLLALQNIDRGLYLDVIDEMERRQPDSLKKDEVKKRVLQVISMFSKGDMTVVQIAGELDTTEFVVYRDLTVRAPKINDYITDMKVQQSLLDNIPLILEKHSKENLTKKK